jgi:predicted sulfurtransferase
MNKKIVSPFVLMAAVVLLSLFQAVNAASASGVEKISIQKLNSSLGSPDLLIIDVRDDIGWSKSAHKIPGAVRENPSDVPSWAGKYPKDKTIVVYCA